MEPFLIDSCSLLTAYGVCMGLILAVMCVFLLTRASVYRYACAHTPTKAEDPNLQKF